MFAFVFAACSLATLVAATPVTRQYSQPGCPWNGTPEVPDTFKLQAVYKSNPVITKQLALATEGSTAPGTTAWVATAESIFTPIIGADFTMLHGGLLAHAPNGDLTAEALPVPQLNGWLNFTVNDPHSTTYPAEAYCELFNTGAGGAPIPLELAVNNGDADNFFLCSRHASEQWIVVYNVGQASSVDAGYDFNTCQAVTLQILPNDSN
ncbi:hypothetical protein BC834DRAFT_974705 [Gloeopeniophorella convolvens]|nr:hypothetical protein BC834DRAFT_974705 [Gloeopeniophorella convolvens]